MISQSRCLQCKKLNIFFILQKYYKLASKNIKIRNLWLTKFPVTQLLQRLISQKVDHEFSQTVGLQKNLPTKTVAFIVYWYRFITNIAIFINFCTENIYPNYINGILYSKTGDWSQPVCSIQWGIHVLKRDWQSY